MIDQNQIVPGTEETEAHPSEATPEPKPVEPSLIGRLYESAKHMAEKVKDAVISGPESLVEDKTNHKGDFESAGRVIPVRIIGDDDALLNETFEEAKETCEQYLGSFGSPFGEYRYVVVDLMNKDIDESFEQFKSSIGQEPLVPTQKTRDQIFAEVS